MKVVLSFSIAIVIYLGLNTRLLNQVNYTGLYLSSNSSSKLILNQLELKKDGTFEYQTLFYGGVVKVHKVKGNYTVKGKKLRLFPTSFEYSPGRNQNTAMDSTTKIRVFHTPGVVNQNSPDFFNRYLVSFESGAARLKPEYAIKHTKEKLSLCLLDLKTEQYHPAFLKEK